MECKKTGEKPGRPLSQAIDYTRSVFDFTHGFMIMLRWVFVWPLEKQHGALASIMAQNKVGGIQYEDKDFRDCIFKFHCGEQVLFNKPKDHLCTTIRRGPLDKSGRLMSKRTIGKIVENCAKKAGITKRVYPHLLRHSVATHLIEEGVDIRYIQVLLGHSSILATSHYTQIATMPSNTMECKTNYLFD